MTLTNRGIGVANGTFTAVLDFGSGVFTGSPRWLEMAVRTNGANGFSILTPRQALLSTPYAMMAGGLSGPVLNGGLSGSYTNPVIISNAANVFTGDGSGLTGLDGAHLVPGSVHSAQLAPGSVLARLQADGQSGVAFGGVVLSAQADNPNLVNAGYVKIGALDLTAEIWNNYQAGPPGSGLVDHARTRHTAVWTGSQMLIWGGHARVGLTNDGACYNPVTDTWVRMSTVGAPLRRDGHTALWVGNVMVIWGGEGPDCTYEKEGRTYRANSRRDGACYHPATDTWTAMNTNNAPAPRAWHCSVSTGSELIVWGGWHWWDCDYSVIEDGTLNYQDGARYNPSTDTWTAFSTTNTPAGRTQHTAVWTGWEMIVWGGKDTLPLGTGGRFNPALNTWTALSLNGAPAPRWGHTAVCDGAQMFIWGGTDGTNYFGNGARYVPTADVWLPITMAGAPPARADHVAVWTGSQMLIATGARGVYYLDSTFSYVPARTLGLYVKP